MPRGTLIARSAAVFAACALLAGCTAGSVAERSYPGTPAGYTGETNLLNGQPLALWLQQRTVLGIVTFGRTSCAPVPTSISAPDAATIVITFAASTEQCGGELEPTTHEFPVPSNIDSSSPVTAELRFGEQSYPVPVVDN